MIGAEHDPGIIPRACKHIFDKIKNESEENTKYEVFCTMMEIYNEKIFDLLNPTRTPLKVTTIKNRTFVKDLVR